LSNTIYSHTGLDSMERCHALAAAAIGARATRAGLAEISR
jgi:hypothetical protein